MPDGNPDRNGGLPFQTRRRRRRRVGRTRRPLAVGDLPGGGGERLQGGGHRRLLRSREPAQDAGDQRPPAGGRLVHHLPAGDGDRYLHRAAVRPGAVPADQALAHPPKVQALVQAESLFNDATSLVLFQIAVSIAIAGTAGTTAGGMLLHGPGQFAVLAAGGAAAGGVVAAGVIAVRRRVTDPVPETVLALVTPYAAYVLGAALHVSPVMAVIVAGLIIGARRARITTAQTRLQLHSVYQTVIFLLESVVFSLIGLRLPVLIRDLAHTEAWPAGALAVAGTLIATRILWVFPLSAVLQRRAGTRRPSWPVPAVVSWAGTCGVVPLAAALSIPLTIASGASLPERGLVLVLATAVIVISLIVQGLTLEPAGPVRRDRPARHGVPRGNPRPAAPG
ncbi:MAG TPA: cation:proton antiporter [Streptosporangiaceae bacterium]|nr:cation:proton antiporter [Streptosporangiaceae bacterium]